LAYLNLGHGAHTQLCVSVIIIANKMLSYRRETRCRVCYSFRQK